MAKDDRSGAIREIHEAFTQWSELAAPHLSTSDQTVLASYDELDRARERLATKIDTYAKAQTNSANELAATSATALTSSLLWIGAMIVIGLVIGICISWYGVNYLRRELGGEPREVMKIARQIADGDLQGSIDIVPGADHSIAAAMSSMQASLSEFVEEQTNMGHAHEAGALDHDMDVAKFKGVYQQMAQSINELVRSHIGVQMRTVEVMKSYAMGDFSLELDRMPGERARITEAMDAVRHNLLAINDEVAALVQAASKGDFSARGNAEQYSFRFKEMIDGLNTLMETAQTGLSEVASVLGALASGNLTQRAASHFEGAFGKLNFDANATMESLTRIAVQIGGSTESISTISQEIATNNSDLSKRTLVQASRIDETTGSMKQLTHTVKRSAQSAQQANHLVVEASDVAMRGGKVVHRVVNTISAISESSKKIADIISMIDGIAFQTNILAINAAVEAVRAGEQGRGFAIVATEVRNLAQRSAAAAKEINELLTNTVAKVESGSELADEAGRTMEDIVESVKRITDIMASITTASAEQSTEIDQVSEAITQIDDFTKQNASLVSQTANTAQELRDQAKVLSQAVSLFKLSDETGCDSPRQIDDASDSTQYQTEASLKRIA